VASYGGLLTDDALEDVVILVHRREAFGLAADEVVRGDGQRGIASRRLRDYRGGRAVTDGTTSAFTPRFIPAEQVKAADYRSPQPEGDSRN
jgi:hypothetical protein